MANAENGFGAGRRMLRRTLSLGWKLAVVAAVAAGVVYRVYLAPAPVESRVAAVGPIAAEVLGTGTLEARVQATVSSKIAGRIVQVLADQGDRITKGQLLATLDDGDLRQQVEMAKADLDAAKAGVDRAAAEIVRAEAVAKLARVSYERVSRLMDTRAASADEFDKATQDRDASEADLRRAHLAKVELEKQVLKAEDALRYYQERLGDTKIVSPFDGLVVRRSREPGDVVVPGSDILEIISTDQMWVSAWVDESALAAVAVGQPARVVFRSEPAKPCSGTVTRLSPLADRETREFVVDVTVQDLPKSWAVGQRAEVYIKTAGKEQALLAPQQAIAWREGKPGLFVGNDGHALWRSVTLGMRGADSVEVVKGLAGGERIIWPRDPKGGPLVEGRAVSAP